MMKSLFTFAPKDAKEMLSMTCAMKSDHLIQAILPRMNQKLIKLITL